MSEEHSWQPNASITVNFRNWEKMQLKPKTSKIIIHQILFEHYLRRGLELSHVAVLISEADSLNGYV